LVTTKRIFVNSKNKERGMSHLKISPKRVLTFLYAWGGFLIALRVLNPFKRPFDVVISSFERRRKVLKNQAIHADRRAQKFDQQQKQLDKFLKLLRYNELDCGRQHAMSQGSIQGADDVGGWLLRRDEFQKWSSIDRNASPGLLWVHGKREHDLWIVLRIIS
jgi:hypothetical protein